MSTNSIFENTLIQSNFKMFQGDWWSKCQHPFKLFRIFFQEDPEYLFYDFNIPLHDKCNFTSTYLQWIRYDCCQSCQEKYIIPLLCSEQYYNIRLFKIIDNVEIDISEEYGCVGYPINPNNTIYEPEDDDPYLDQYESQTFNYVQTYLYKDLKI